MKKKKLSMEAKVESLEGFTTRLIDGVKTITEINSQLTEACEYMIRITGGSQQWNGETHTALKKIEQAVYHARKSMSIANIGGEREVDACQEEK